MSTNPNTPPAGGKPATSGAEGDGDSVSRDAHEKLLKEKQNAMSSLTAERDKAKALQDQIDALKNEQLTKQGEYKELYEKERQKTSTLETELKGLKTKTFDSKKREALTKELFKFGLDEKLLDDTLKVADFSGITVDTETLSVVGADSVAKGIYEKYKSFGFFKANGAKPNHQGIKPGGPNAKPNSPLGEKTISQMTQNEKLEALRKLHAK